MDAVTEKAEKVVKGNDWGNTGILRTDSNRSNGCKRINNKGTEASGNSWSPVKSKTITYWDLLRQDREFPNLVVVTFVCVRQARKPLSDAWYKRVEIFTHNIKLGCINPNNHHLSVRIVEDKQWYSESCSIKSDLVQILIAPWHKYSFKNPCSLLIHLLTRTTLNWRLWHPSISSLIFSTGLHLPQLMPPLYTKPCW